MELSLGGKTALVCGSTSGIGKGIAKLFATSDANVVLIARNEEKLKVTLGELANNGSQLHHYIAADFSQPQELKEKISLYMQTQPQVDILVNNSGGPPAGPIIEAEIEKFLKAYDMHLVCNHILTQAVYPGMRERGSGRIINIISTSVRQPIPNLGVSNTTRGAIGNWAKTMANELGPFGITVNNILPGSIMTPRLVSILNNRAEKQGKSFEQVKEEMKKSIPLRRIGEPDDIAMAALFLASEAGSYVSGTNLIVDGGRTKTY